MNHVTSGPLVYSEVKGLHYLNADWSINLNGHGLFDFLLASYDGHVGSELTGGWLHCRKGYLWDGSSGPTVDGAADPVPSLVHDTIYEAFRDGRLPLTLRATADEIYYQLLIERGMSKFRAGLRWAGLRMIGWSAASKSKGPQYPVRNAT